MTFLFERKRNQSTSGVGQQRSFANYRHQVLAVALCRFKPAVHLRLPEIIAHEVHRGRDILTHLILPELGDGGHIMSSIDVLLFHDLQLGAVSFSFGIVFAKWATDSIVV